MRRLTYLLIGGWTAALVLFSATLGLVTIATAVTSNSALRDPKQVAAFRKLQPCPDGPDKGSTRKCAGYVVDHKNPLCAGGADAPSNMAYMHVADAKLKDVLEVRLCKCLGTMK